jgi:hypothetical protein
MGEEESKQKADAGKEAAENDEKMAELGLAAQKEALALADSGRRQNDQRRAQEETAAANADVAIKMAAFAKEAAALDKSGKDYENKLKAIQDKEKQAVQQHENEITAIKDKAEMDRNQRVLSAETRFQDTLATGLTQSIMRHQSWSRMLVSLGDQVVAGMLANAIKSILADDMTKERDAAAAARKAFNAGMQFPFPANIVMGPALGAAAFASVMAFSAGGVVPGYGTGDTVPAMLTPGEGVIPKNVMDAANNPGSGPANHYHLRANYAPTVHALDSEGVDRVLDKHGAKFQKHFEHTVRKMNR